MTDHSTSSQKSCILTYVLTLVNLVQEKCKVNSKVIDLLFNIYYITCKYIFDGELFNIESKLAGNATTCKHERFYQFIIINTGTWAWYFYKQSWRFMYTRHESRNIALYKRIYFLPNQLFSKIIIPGKSLAPFSNRRTLVHRPESLSCRSLWVFLFPDPEPWVAVDRRTSTAFSWYSLLRGLKRSSTLVC